MAQDDIKGMQTSMLAQAIFDELEAGLEELVAPYVFELMARTDTHAEAFRSLQQEYERYKKVADRQVRELEDKAAVYRRAATANAALVSQLDRDGSY